MGLVVIELGHSVAALYGPIEPEMLRHSNAEWQARFDAKGVPCAAVQNTQQMLDHEQTRALGILQNVPGSGIPLIGLPLSCDGVRPQPRNAAPEAGADTCQIFANRKES